MSKRVALRLRLAAALTFLSAALALCAFRPVGAPHDWAFPRDHGAHPDFQTEWWYYTGHLHSEDGRSYGYELTIFRRALEAPGDAGRFPDWRPAAFFPAHFAITDESGHTFQHWERLKRDIGGLAGADTSGLRVWCGDWSAAARGEGQRLEASAGDWAIGLDLDPEKPPVLQGPGGISRKGALPGQASYYYSMTRLATSGTITAGGKRLVARGVSWMDHEFFSTDLDTTLVGWDWFSLQLDDRSDLMLYSLRRTGGARSTWASGTVVPPAGAPQPLEATDFAIEATGRWVSPATGVSYPAGWRVTLPSAGLDLTLEPTVAGQELDTRSTTGVIYWEGSVNVRGTRRGRPLSGVGYVELTGYDGHVPMQKTPGATGP